MIETAIGFLKNRLNRTFPRDLGGAAEDLFVYPSVGKDETVSFPANAVRSDREANSDFVRYVGFAD